MSILTVEMLWVYDSYILEWRYGKALSFYGAMGVFSAVGGSDGVDY